MKKDGMTLFKVYFTQLFNQYSKLGGRTWKGVMSQLIHSTAPVGHLCGLDFVRDCPASEKKKKKHEEEAAAVSEEEVSLRKHLQAAHSAELVA